MLYARFSRPSSISELPSWVRPHCKAYNNFGAALKDMMIFFKTAEKLVSVTLIIYQIKLCFTGLAYQKICPHVILVKVCLEQIPFAYCTNYAYTAGFSIWCTSTGLAPVTYVNPISTHAFQFIPKSCNMLCFSLKTEKLVIHHLSLSIRSTNKSIRCLWPALCEYSCQPLGPPSGHLGQQEEGVRGHTLPPLWPGPWEPPEWGTYRSPALWCHMCPASRNRVHMQGSFMLTLHQMKSPPSPLV